MYAQSLITCRRQEQLTFPRLVGMQEYIREELKNAYQMRTKCNAYTKSLRSNIIAKKARKELEYQYAYLLTSSFSASDL